MLTTLDALSPRPDKYRFALKALVVMSVLVATVGAEVIPERRPLMLVGRLLGRQETFSQSWRWIER